MNNRTHAAVTILKEAKTQGLTYHAATQRLSEQGFSQDEIAHAAYQFPYGSAKSTPKESSAPHLDQALAKAVVHQQAIGEAKKEFRKNALLSMFFKYSFFEGYFNTKAETDFTTLRELQSQTSTGEPKDPSHGPERSRVLRVFSILCTAIFAITIPAFLIGIGQLPNALDQVRHDGGPSIALAVCLLAVITLITAVGLVPLLFWAKNKVIVRWAVCCWLVAQTALLIGMAVLNKSPLFLAAVAISVLIAYWINRKTVLLSQPSGQ